VVEFSLPFVDEGAHIDTALQLMRRVHCSGVVSEVEGGVVMYTADELLERAHQLTSEKKSLAVPLAVIVPHFPIAPASVAGAMERRSDRGALRAWLEQSGAAYALVNVTWDRRLAEIITGSDRLTEILQRAPVICQCSAEPTHLFRPDDVSNGKCSIDGAAVICS